MDSSSARRPSTPRIGVERIHPDARLPERMSESASGWDLSACVEDPITIEPGCWVAVPTGIALEIPPGYEGQVRPRSGLALKHGIGILNGPGTIDADYRGEVRVILINWGRERFRVCGGDRIAQLVFARVEPVTLRWVEKLTETSRGEGGFGHTGVSTD